MSETFYDYGNARAYAASIGMAFDEEYAAIVDPVFRGLDLSQAQVDVLIRVHADHVKSVFTPANYSLPFRLFLAAHFAAPAVVRGVLRAIVAIRKML